MIKNRFKTDSEIRNHTSGHAALYRYSYRYFYARAY
jgi:hypothetical protein